VPTKCNHIHPSPSTVPTFNWTSASTNSSTLPHNLTTKSQNALNRAWRRFEPVGSEFSIRLSRAGDGAYRMEGLKGEDVAADGDGDLSDASQEQHLAVSLHGPWSRCSALPRARALGGGEGEERTTRETPFLFRFRVRLQLGPSVSVAIVRWKAETSPRLRAGACYFFYFNLSIFFINRHRRKYFLYRYSGKGVLDGPQSTTMIDALYGHVDWRRHGEQ
jgi:hypothetical protein